MDEGFPPSKSDERKVRRPMGRMGWSGRVRGMKITIVGRKVNLRNNFKEAWRNGSSQNLTVFLTRMPEPPSP